MSEAPTVEYLAALAAEFTIAPVREDHQHRCYELASKRVAYGPDHSAISGYDGAVLVHGTIEQGGDPLYHAWVIEPDGSVWEPVTDTAYTPRAFHVLFWPTEIVRYEVAEARGLLHERYHCGPYAREAWQGEGFEDANGEWED